MKSLFFVAVLFAQPSFSEAKCSPEEQIRDLALAMYSEARYAHDEIHMQLVGEVVLNRVESVNYPDTICDVVFQKHQFTDVDKVKIEEEDSWELAESIAEDLITGEIEYYNNGATNFLNPEKMKKMPHWTKKFKKILAYGNHVFYTDNSDRNVIYFN
jgi:spore germination cell wall hydrolase CwlJ-like protein